MESEAFQLHSSRPSGRSCHRWRLGKWGVKRPAFRCFWLTHPDSCENFMISWVLTLHFIESNLINRFHRKLVPFFRDKKQPISHTTPTTNQSTTGTSTQIHHHGHSAQDLLTSPKMQTKKSFWGKPRFFWPALLLDVCIEQIFEQDRWRIQKALFQKVLKQEAS